jgi:uncharacterized lipoprotein YddW (UPF0748 family)
MRLLVFSVIMISLFAATGAQDNPKREMRAVWIATVENIDWPSSPTLSVDIQQKEMTSLLNLVKEYNLNTVVFQIRPAADAFYNSALEPWSQWLTGQQGKAPDPFYDPLEFVIRECRKRGLDIHVWLNPYRAIRDTAFHATSPDHITNTHPELLLTYGTTRYFDPGLPPTRSHMACVVSDIVRRYDIDAIHMDDYFYPYRIAGIRFPDDNSFALYHGEFNTGQRDDWRRNNVDLIIKQLHDSIKAIKPWVEFGISPFGVWRNADKDPSGSATKAGQTNYDDLFADVLKWQKEGWIDYVTPQLYWQIGMPAADYAVLADWWNRNTYGCPLYIGQAFYRIDQKSPVKAWRSSGEIIKQINLNRTLSNIKGSMFFSAKYLRTNPLRLKQKLLKKLYRYSALPPANERITAVTPDLPANATIHVLNDTIRLAWEKGSNTKNFIIYKFRKGRTTDLSNPENIFSVTADTTVKIKINPKTRLPRYYYVITSQSQTKIESEPVVFSKNNPCRYLDSQVATLCEINCRFNQKIPFRNIK